jgi:hypothetical protein
MLYFTRVVVGLSYFYIYILVDRIQIIWALLPYGYVEEPHVYNRLRRDILPGYKYILHLVE